MKDLRPDDLKKMSENYFQTIFKPVKHIHIDLDCMKDFNVGVLLKNISTDVEYKYIISHLSGYNRSLDIKTAEYFPVFNMTEEQIISAKKNKENSEFLSVGSPVTNLYSEVFEMIKYSEGHINRFDRNIKPTLHFCCNYFTYSRIARKKLLDDIKQYGVTDNIDFVDFGINEAPITYLKMVDLFIIYDIKGFLHSSNICSAVQSDPMFMNKYVLAPYQYDRDVIKSSNEEVYDLLKKQEQIMNVMFPFSFITKYIPLEETIHNG